MLLGGQIADVVPGQQGEGRIAEIFPEAAVALVTVAGGLGLVLYRLLVGITIDPAAMRERAGAVVLLAVAMVGAMLALALVAGPLLAEADGWKAPGVTHGAFVLALAAALTANGVPIVARMLEDRKMTSTAVGSIVILAGALPRSSTPACTPASPSSVSRARSPPALYCLERGLVAGRSGVPALRRTSRWPRPAERGSHQGRGQTPAVIAP